MERSVMLVKVTADCGQEKWYEKGQIYLVFSCPQIYNDVPSYQAVGYSSGISLRDCEYLNEDPFKYVRGLCPEGGLMTFDEFIDGYISGGK